MKIAIASGKGGTGKTTLSTNLATYIAKNKQVILADLDVEEPNSSIFLISDLPQHQENINKMIPEWDGDACIHCNKCKDNCNFNAIIQLGSEILVLPELCHSCYACSELCPADALPMKPIQLGVLSHYSKSNLEFIESRLDLGQEQAVPLINQTLEYVDNNSSGKEIIIFDSPPGTSCPMIEVVKNSDYIILVTEPTPFGLNDLQIAVETVKLLKKPCSVVVNRAGGEFKGIDSYCEEENIKIISKIPEDRAIAKLYSEGKLLVGKHEGFTREIRNIYNLISEKEERLSI